MTRKHLVFVLAIIMLLSACNTPVSRSTVDNDVLDELPMTTVIVVEPAMTDEAHDMQSEPPEVAVDPPITAETAAQLVPIVDFQDGDDYIYDLSFSPDGRYLASGTTTSAVHIWDAETGDRVAHLLGHTSRVTAVAFSPDGRWLASGSRDKTIILWDTSTWTEVRRFEDHENFIGVVAFSPDSTLLVGGGRPIIVWDVVSGEQVFVIEGSALTLLDLAFSPDGSMLAASHGDATLYLWSMTDGTLLRTFTGESTTSHAAFAHSGLLAGASSSSSSQTGESLGRIFIWDPVTGERVASSQEKLEVLDMAFSSDDSLLIASIWERNELQLLSPQDGRPVHILDEHDDPMYTIAMSADGARLASADSSGRIIIWAVRGE